ncbi:MAG TPA: glycosyltransferase family 2 protein [Myxococcota bacterium]|nr:glycosyltransferase family 2 protein [Myxococcota bacterium]
MTPEDIAERPSVSVVVPTYREVLNLPLLIGRLGAVRSSAGLDIELLVMDDDSRDGSVEAVEGSRLPWARIVVRRENRGLSPAVVDGLRLAKNDVLVVMDADLSHPPEKLPEMIAALRAGRDFVIGSRYVPGASTDDEWGLARWVNSRVATLLARPLTAAKDPMSGFFAFRRADLARARELSPVGYKIGLELIVKCGFRDVGEVPIHFADRELGESKLTLKEQLLYLKHLRRLYNFKFGAWSHLAQFLVVGATGLAVNLLVLTALETLGVSVPAAVALSIVVAMLSNFALNRRFTFSDARGGSLWKQLVGFMGACSIGAAINWAVTLWLVRQAPELPIQVAALGGVVAGTAFNYLTSRFLVFRAGD